MKRLLVLILMLGLAAAAQANTAWFEVAGLTKNALGQYEINPGDVLTINLKADTTCDVVNANYIVEMDAAGNQADFGGVASGVTVAAGNTNASAATMLDGYQGALFMSENDYWANTPYVVAGNTIMSFTYTVAADFIGKTVAIGGLGLDKYFTADDGSVYGGWLLDPADESFKTTVKLGTDLFEIQSAVLVNTPEPMTVALLGLGGLFLRRKK